MSAFKLTLDHKAYCTIQDYVLDRLDVLHDSLADENLSEQERARLERDLVEANLAHDQLSKHTQVIPISFDPEPVIQVPIFPA